MDEEKNDQTPEEQEKPPYIPAPRSRRIAAWVGIILMIFLVIMYSYSIATGAFLSW